MLGKTKLTMKKTLLIICAASLAVAAIAQVVITTNSSITQIRKLKQIQVDFPGTNIVLRGYFFQNLTDGTNTFLSNPAGSITLSGTNLDTALSNAGFSINSAQLRALLVKLMMTAWTNNGSSDVVSTTQP